MREKICELLSHGLKGELLQRAPLRFGHDRAAGIDVVQQLQRDGSDFVDRASFAASFWKRDSFNRAVAARANHPAKKRVPRDLSRHSATVELQNDFMFRDFAQIIRVRFSLLNQPQFSIGKF